MITRIFAVCIVLAGIHGCGQSAPLKVEESDKANSLAVRSTCPPMSASEFFFPSGTLVMPGSTSDDIMREWYNKQLLAMGESSLSCGEGRDAFRFTWLRSFHRPVSVRVDIDVAATKATLFAIELDGPSGNSTGNEGRRTQRELKKAELQLLRRAIQAERLWSLPRTESRLGTDGSRWVLEVREGERYHVVDRWTPDDGPVRRLGLAFIQLTGWQFADVY